MIIYLLFCEATFSNSYDRN